MARILYVEDNVDRAERVRPLLEEKGHTVKVVRKAGLAMMSIDRGEVYDALVLHLLLPGIDGVEFCRWIEHDTPLSGIPKVAFIWQGHDLNLGVEQGVPCWLPVNCLLRQLDDVERLIEAVEGVLNSRNLPSR